MTQRIGLDIGTTTVRAIAMARDRGTWRIDRHAAVARRDDQGVDRPLAMIIEELSATMSVSRPDAVATSGLEVLVRFLPVAPLPYERLHRLLRLELTQHLDGGEPSVDAIRLAVPGEDLFYAGLTADTLAVNGLIADLKRAGVVPRTLGFGAAALGAVAMGRIALEEGQMALVCDIGATGTDVALVGDGCVLAFRRLLIGGDQFTQALVEAGMTPARAEQAKVAGEHAAVQTTSSEDGLPASVIDGDELRLDIEEPAPLVATPGAATMQLGSDTLGPAMAKVAEGLYGQLTASVAFFRAQLKHDRLVPTKVLLCGGGSGLVGLDAYLHRRFQIPVERWQPLDGCSGQTVAEPHLWARAAGLAMAQDQGLAVDLRPDRIKLGEAWRRRVIWPYIAAACMLIAGVIAAWILDGQIERDKASTAAFDRAVSEHKRLSAELAELERERESQAEDLRAIAARIHGARDLLYTIRVLKEQCPESKELWVTSLQTMDIGKDTGAPATGTTKLGSGPKNQRRDSLIDRGAVDISGQVKFDGYKSDAEMRQFVHDYQKALLAWTMPEGGNLFRDIREDTDRTGVVRTKGDKGDTGKAGFTFRCYFQPTELVAQPAPAPAPAPAPVNVEGKP